MNKIPFNKPCIVGGESEAIGKVLESNKLSGDGAFTKEGSEVIRTFTGTGKVLLTTSCTHALEMASLLLDIKTGDEVIMPSFTFVSTANAFVLRGATVVFVDIVPETLNVDPEAIKRGITNKTKAIVVVHYAGVACDMDRILEIGREYGIPVVEDAAQGYGAFHNGRHLGTIGVLGAFSFHDTKNITCGEGGALLVNQDYFEERSEILREKGTNRSRFLRGQVDKYTWVDVGSSYLLSELNAAFLLSQVKKAEIINKNRLATWSMYYDGLNSLSRQGKINLPVIPGYASHNAHMFYIKTKDLEERTHLIKELGNEGISAVSHYVPLHSSPYGLNNCRFDGEDVYTTKESERLLRLPLYYGLEESDTAKVINAVNRFFR